MVKRLDIYRCSICGITAEVLDGGDGEMLCCGQPMNRLVASKEEAGSEKHVPVIEKIDSGFRVTVGSIAHPMEEKHYIEWIELLADGKAYRHFLKPGGQPVAEFNVEAEVESVSAREYCSVHGLWKKGCMCNF